MDRRMIVYLAVGALAYYAYLKFARHLIDGNPLQPTPTVRAA